MTIRFGVTLPQFTGKRDRFVTGALRAEDLGYDSVWVFDHLWPLGGGRERPVLEAWTALAYLAAATRRVSVGSLVTRSSLRHPVLLAKMIATVGAIAPGRLICGLGSGDELSRPENEAFGLTYLSGVDRINQLASTLEIVTAYSSEGVAGHTDGFAHVTSLPTSPQPDPVPAIWIGGWSRPILRLAGEGADGWNGWGTDPRRFARAVTTVREAAAGRELELSWGGQVIVAGSDAAASEALGDRDPDQCIVGAPATVAAKLRSFVDAGAGHLIASFPDAGGRGSYELFAEAVVPELRV